MILITGAAGFIGSNIVATLNLAGRDDLLLSDWLGTDGKWENLSKRCFSDIVRPDQLAEALRAPGGPVIELVVHMGAISETTATDGDLVLDRNYRFTRMLWEFCASRGATFVYASSAATYGDGERGFDDKIDLAGLKRLRPLNLYGWSKHIFDLFALSDSTPAPPRWYGLKLFNVFGPNEYHKGSMRSVICKLAPDIIARRPSKLFKSHRDGVADGGQKRDFIYVADVCDVVAHFAKAGAPSGIYNVGTGDARSFADLVAAASQAIGLETIIDYVPMPTELQSRYQYFTQADTTKLRDAAGFNQPFTSLETAVADYMITYLTKPDPYR